ncbi:WD repeat-containing protein 20-like isoform X2 [Apostichopus japonicus]|uniref:WD repeat-containing protein 20-like isoform X2 n=1 Tax=Stichopus japonicus TaxID=307972 RepID=UPI003AB2D228
MAASEGGGKEEVKQQFNTREGVYKLMRLSEYSKPTRLTYNSQNHLPVKVSFISLDDGDVCNDMIFFNIGRELYFYPYKGVRKAADLTKPSDKRTYKGSTLPTCHDFNQLTASPKGVYLIVGFSAGQVQLIDPIGREISKIFNEERQIEKSKVTTLRWVPGTEHMFLVTHFSGSMYLYNDELEPVSTPPIYQILKQGEDYAVLTCKSKVPRNPVQRWVIGEGALHEFAFSNDTKYVATVSHDGFMRVFHYDSMEKYGSMKSYFGGLLCVCWSPDDKYIVVGGEDDLVSIWSFHEKRVVGRGRGHNSWVSVVSFDPFTTEVLPHNMDVYASDEDIRIDNHRDRSFSSHSRTSVHSTGGDGTPSVSYRFGSVGQDTQLCLWDFSEDQLLRFQPNRTRTSTQISQSPQCNNVPHSKDSNASSMHPDGTQTLSSRLTSLSLTDKPKDKSKKDSISRTARQQFLNKMHETIICIGAKAMGTTMCPKLDDVFRLEPLITKKIAYDRLTTLIFREDCIVTGCQEGIINTWARPGKVVSSM